LSIELIALYKLGEQVLGLCNWCSSHYDFIG